MIILLSNDEINKKIAEVLEESPSLPKLESCAIIDINDKNQLSKNILTPELLVEKLIQIKLPQSIKDIYLLVSEVSSEYPLSVYAHNLSKILSEKLHHQIKTHIVSSLNYDMSIINFSSEEPIWKVYGETNEQKTLLWEGDNILDFMNSPQQTFDGKAYVFRL